MPSEVTRDSELPQLEALSKFALSDAFFVLGEDLALVSGAVLEDL